MEEQLEYNIRCNIQQVAQDPQVSFTMGTGRPPLPDVAALGGGSGPQLKFGGGDGVESGTFFTAGDG